MTTAFVSRNVTLVDDKGQMSEAWYRFMQELYQWSGLAGSNFPLYASGMVAGHHMMIDAVAPPDMATFVGDIEAPAFDATANERLHFAVLLPFGYQAGSELVPVVRWAPADSGAGAVRWILEYAIAPHGSAYGAPTAVALESPAAGTALEHLEQLGGGIDAKAQRPGSIALCSIYRDAVHINDTYAGDAFLLAAGFILQNSALGSQTQSP